MMLSGEEQTKAEITRSVKEMMGTTPVSKIRMRRLCRMGGIRRRQLRYFFRNKQDLLEWVFYSELLPQLLRCKGDSDAFLTQLWAYLYENRAVYPAVLASERRNAFLRSYNKVAPLLAKEFVLSRYADNALSRDRLADASAVLSGCFREALFAWLSEPMPKPPEAFAQSCLAALDSYADLAQCFQPASEQAF